MLPLIASQTVGSLSFTLVNLHPSALTQLDGLYRMWHPFICLPKDKKCQTVRPPQPHVTSISNLSVSFAQGQSLVPSAFKLFCVCSHHSKGRKMYVHNIKYVIEH